MQKGKQRDGYGEDEGRKGVQLSKSLVVVVGVCRGTARSRLRWELRGGVAEKRLKTSGIRVGWRVKSKARRCVIKLIRQEERDDSSQQQPDGSCVFYVPTHC